MTLVQVVQKIPNKKLSSDFKETAFKNAVEAFSLTVVQSLPILTNVAALTLFLGESPLVYSLCDDAIELLESTDLRSFPREAPRLLKSACIIEGASGSLFGKTTDLGIYPLPDSRIGIIGFTGRNTEGGAFSTVWTPHWESREGEYDIYEYGNFETDSSPEQYDDWVKDAIRFLIVFSIMLEVDKRPITLEDASHKLKKSVRHAEQKKGRTGWRTKKISLTSRPIKPNPNTEDNHEPHTLPDGRIGTTVYVSGHMVNQAYGPKWSQHRWIYREGFEARRWIAPGSRKVEVTS